MAPHVEGGPTPRASFRGATCGYCVSTLHHRQSSSLSWYCQLGSLPSLATVAPPVGFKADLSAAATQCCGPKRRPKPRGSIGLVLPSKAQLHN